MTSSLVRGAAFGALLVLSVAAASAEPAAPTAGSPPAAASAADASAKPDVATLLFGTPMWDLVPAGSKLHYTFEKTTSEAALGTSFKDTIMLTLGAGDDAQSRTTEMQLFSGMNRKPAGPFRSDQQNPLLLVILENNVQELSGLFKANPRYLKNAIRKAWRDNAKIEQAQDTIDGKPMAVTRISVTPFVGDSESDRMKGLQTMVYVVDVSKDVPGYIAAMDIHAVDGGKTLFSETLRYASETKP